MIIPLLQRERSIDDFVDREGNCRLAALIADNGSVSQEEKLYTREVHSLVRAGPCDTTGSSTRWCQP